VSEYDAPPYVIRRLAQDEVERVVAVLALARLHQGNGYYLVAWQEGDPVGHAHLALTDPPELQDVSVRPSHRRRGIATSLTLAVEQEARSLGFDRIQLQVSADDKGTQALYHKCGYIDAGLPPQRVKGTIQIRTGPIDVDDTLLVWEKRLTATIRREE
jgi:ribosomal protein S18 acetylase RimI-like enzyme